MSDVGSIDAFSIYSHYLQGIYKLVYTGTKWFNDWGEYYKDYYRPTLRCKLQTVELAQSRIPVHNHRQHTSNSTLKDVLECAPARLHRFTVFTVLSSGSGGACVVNLP